MDKRDLVIVIGKNSQLAQAIADYIERQEQTNSFQIHFFDRASLDLTSPSSLLLALNPYLLNRELYNSIVLVNTAAYTQVEKAEEEPQKALEVNATGVQNLVQIAQKNRLGILHISTDFVFDGEKRCPYTEEDTPYPLSVYGKSKLEGEKTLKPLQREGMAMVIRTSWLYYHKAAHGNFLLTIADKLKKGTPLNVVNDQLGVPTNAYDLAEFIVLALKLFFKEGRFREPLLHFCNEGSATWYDYALAIATYLGLPSDILPVSSNEYPSRALRPHYSLMSTQLLKSVYNYHPRKWSEALAETILRLPGNEQKGGKRD